MFLTFDLMFKKKKKCEKEKNKKIRKKSSKKFLNKKKVYTFVRKLSK